jgi:dihydrofolate reductase
VIFNTAVTINGYIADLDDSMTWLFDVPGEHPHGAELMARTTVVVMGSTTYEWLLQHENLLVDAEKWQRFFGSRPVFVFTTRQLAIPAAANVRLVQGPVANVLEEIRHAAGGGSVWVQGGGDLAGQFFDAGALDEIALHIAPVFLPGGRPLFPRRVLSERLALEDVREVGQFVVCRYSVRS